MIQIRKEGEKIRQGLSFYHPRDPHSIGGLLRVGNHVLRLRWSKPAKRLFTGYDKIDPKAMEKLKQWEAENGINKS